MKLKEKKLTACIMAAALVLTATPQAVSAASDKFGTCYEVFVYSFCDSDGDGIGDLQGLISKLDYIEELGFDSIWLMPVNPSTTYHKYDVTDYYDIDPEYGTLEDFDELISECSERGIRIFMDMVINHTSAKHPWFQSATDYLRTLKPGEKADAKECEYVSFYNFEQGEEGMRDGWQQVEGTSDWYYECVFWDQMPDLNLENEAVREELEDVADFWIDRGVRGFRMDAALHYTESDVTASAEQLKWFYDYVESIDPKIYVVAEVWSTQMTIERFYRESGIDSLFDFVLGSPQGAYVSALKSFGGGSCGRNLARKLESLDSSYREANPNEIDGVFITNHDTDRAASILGYDMTKLKLAAALELLTTGCVYVYYGEELGMTGAGIDENKRAPMPWSAADAEGMTDGPQAMEEQENRFAPCDEQIEDESSIYNYYKAVIAIRNAYPELRAGVTEAMEEVMEKNGNICAVKKTYGDNSLCLLYNLSSVEVTFEIPDSYGCTGLAESLSEDAGSEAEFDGRLLTLPASTFAILK